MLRKLGFNYSVEEYGQVSLYRVIKQAFGNIRRKFLQNMMDWALLEPLNPRKLRPVLLRKIGCKVGKDVFVGDYVRVDLNHAEMIEIEDGVHIASGCRLLCHQRDLSNYFAGTVNRAPVMAQKMGLEWFYRLVQQPIKMIRFIKPFTWISSKLVKSYLRKAGLFKKLFLYV